MTVYPLFIYESAAFFGRGDSILADRNKSAIIVLFSANIKQKQDFSFVFVTALTCLQLALLSIFDQNRPYLSKKQVNF